MQKISTNLQFKLKKELCVTTIEKDGGEMTPTMRVIKKCTDFIDEFCHSLDDEYEIKYATHIDDPDGKSETFAVNFSYVNSDGKSVGTYSYFVVFTYLNETIDMCFTMRHKKSVNGNDVIQNLKNVLDEIAA